MTTAPAPSTRSARRPARRALGALAVVAVAAVGLAACSSDDEKVDAADGSTTTVAKGDTDQGSDSGSSSKGDDDVLAEIESRGKPSLSKTDPVTELQITDDVEGTGAEVQPNDTITAHYVGVSASTGEEFDSSWDRGEPATFPLNRVIQGWSEGLVGMKEGGRRTLVIPAEMAYGNSPPPGAGIAPGETLVFTVDLVSID